jgi:DNA mismatch repair protein MutS
MQRSVERGEIKALLLRVHDLERLCGRISLAACNARDLIALKSSLETLPDLRGHLAVFQTELIAQLAGQFDDLSDIRQIVEEAILEEPPIALRDGGLIKDGFNAELDELRAISRKGKGYLSEMEARERERTGISKLKIGYNTVFGYYIEISHAKSGAVPSEYIRKQTLVNAERYITPELKEYEEKVLTAQERIVELEYNLFTETRQRVAAEVSRIQTAARVLATIDVLAAFAHLAETYDYVKPEVDESDEIVLVEGRHPVVERMTAGERFIPNDTRLDTSENQIVILTGPNMAGKSTYIRQVALIVLMAQIGCFVPAKKARIGVVDRIFTRVGASDNLARGQSTFMVEMSETAEILHGATRRSLLVLDEIGRGTSTFDGLSIAWAVTEYLHDNPSAQAKTLFATHFHELVDISKEKKRVRNFNIGIIERDNRLIFLHRILAGGTSRSYGIQVAQLAGLPSEVISRAKEILRNLESGELDELGRAKLAARPAEPPGAARGQLSLFGPPRPSPVEEELIACDPQSMTPLEALNFLAQIHEKAKKK